MHSSKSTSKTTKHISFKAKQETITGDKILSRLDFVLTCAFLRSGSVMIACLITFAGVSDAQRASVVSIHIMTMHKFGITAWTRSIAPRNRVTLYKTIPLYMNANSSRFIHVYLNHHSHIYNSCNNIYNDYIYLSNTRKIHHAQGRNQLCHHTPDQC